eukprot:CAMPEP_0181398482 /NCGR_PEP_ID=MMETSP1110-20121109/1064_1 /TAXON_ID=174948 /ORGANISM="Symbiodinium sp., Strain CCMP421" /LENGTH=120 /DNA_ID=CAMNT_0023520435 /DNA_START=430 /DNA_END=789 /DNA_ORIENTATION=-
MRAGTQIQAQHPAKIGSTNTAQTHIARQEESPRLLHLILLCSQSSDERLQHPPIFGLCGEGILQLIRSAGGADREGVHKDIVQHEDSGGCTGQLEAIHAHLAQNTGPHYLPPTSASSHMP